MILIYGVIVLLVGAILCFGVLLQLKSTRGKYGELVIRIILSFLPKEYRVLNDVRFNIGRNRCQIDHLVISPYGIFVIETKNYLGVTSGHTTSPILKRSVLRRRYTTRNPLVQTKRHIELLHLRLNQTLVIDMSTIHSIVVFNFANFLRLNGDHENVIKYYQLWGFIRKFKSVQLSYQEVIEVSNEFDRNHRHVFTFF